MTTMDIQTRGLHFCIFYSPLNISRTPRAQIFTQDAQWMVLINYKSTMVRSLKDPPGDDAEYA